MWLLENVGESSLGVKGLGLDTCPGGLRPRVISHSRFVWTKCLAPQPPTGLKAHLPAHHPPQFIEASVGLVNGGPVAAQLDTPLQNPGIEGDLDSSWKVERWQSVQMYVLCLLYLHFLTKKMEELGLIFSEVPYTALSLSFPIANSWFQQQKALS